MMNWFRLIKNIPLRLNEERSDQLANGHPDGYRRLYLSSSDGLVCPDDALIVAIWRFHFFSRGGRRELKEFLNLARGCRQLLDLGASAGIFSALFANTRSGAFVISVEPEARSYDLLAETARLNQKPGIDWRMVRAVVTDRPGKVSFLNVAGLGGHIVQTGEGDLIESHSLESLSETCGLVPDIIKLDVESYEYEILSGAVDWLRAHTPRLFLELHWELLKQRNLDPEHLLQTLGNIGYRWRNMKDFAGQASRDLDASGVVRLALMAEPS